MKVLNQILYYAFIIGWIIAPMLVNDLLVSRNIYLPSDIATGGIIIWYTIPIVQEIWRNGNKPKKYSN